MNKRPLIVLISLLLGILSGCLHPSGVLDTTQSIGKERLELHPKLKERYGENPIIEYTGGGGTRDMNWRGTSGAETCDFLVNGQDTFSVALSKGKKTPWKADGIVCTSAKYICNELDLIFEGSVSTWASRDELDSVQPNGVLYLNGEKVDVMVTLLATTVSVYDAKLYRQYKEEHALTEPDRLDLPEEQLNDCTLLACNIVGDFDMFIATPKGAYKDFAPEKEYRFYVVGDS